MEERKRYLFRYNDELIADWYATEEQMKFYAQGMVVALRLYRKNPCVLVHSVDENETERLARVQR